MKQNIVVLLAFIAGLTTFSIVGWKANNGAAVNKHEHSSHVTNPSDHPVVALRKVKAKAGVPAGSFEQWATKLPANAYGKIPGVKCYIAKGERGDESGTYLFVIEFDSKQTRDFYYPVAGGDGTKTSAEAARLLQPWNTIASEFGKVGEVVASGKEGYTDFIILQ